jgi:serine/threonine protein phosphatase PrpC
MQFLRNLLSLDKTGPTRRASTPPAPASGQSGLHVGWATHVGLVRRHNEDTALILTAAHAFDEGIPPLGILILADGMGGHRSGELASAVAARVAAHHLLHHFYLPILVGHQQDASLPPLNELLVDAIQAANQAVADQVPGGGTTLTCALILGSRAYIAHVGDSRAYLITPGEVDQITHDHSLVDRLVELGQLTPAEAASHPQKNVLYRAVGQTGTLEVDTYVRTIPDQGHLLLCSDGLWSLVSETEIIDTVTHATSLQEACENLITAANQAGGLDNATAILVKPPAPADSPEVHR